MKLAFSSRQIRSGWVSAKLGGIVALWLPSVIFPALLRLFGQNQMWILLAAALVGFFIGIGLITAWLLIKSKTTVADPSLRPDNEPDSSVEDSELPLSVSVDELGAWSEVCSSVVRELLSNEQNWITLDEEIARDPSRFPVIECFYDAKPRDSFERVSIGTREDGREVFVYGVRLIDEQMKPEMIRDVISCLRFNDDYLGNEHPTALKAIAVNHLFKKSYRSGAIKTHYREFWGKEPSNDKLKVARNFVRDFVPQWSRRGATFLERTIYNSRDDLTTHAGRSIIRQNVREGLTELLRLNSGMV